MKSLVARLIIFSTIACFCIEAIAQDSNNQNYDDSGKYPSGGILPAPPPIPEDLKGDKRDQEMVESSDEKDITVYENCAKVINGHNKNIFVPLGTRKEWDRFKAHPPHQVVLSNCNPEDDLPDGPVDEKDVINRCSEKTHKTAVIKVKFPNPNKTCQWDKNGNQKLKQGHFQARSEQEFGLDIPKTATMCGADFSFKAGKFWYDDVFMLSMDNNVIASSYNWDSVLEKENGFYQYDWDKISGEKWRYWEKSADYCPQEEGGGEYDDKIAYYKKNIKIKEKELKKCDDPNNMEKLAKDIEYFKSKLAYYEGKNKSSGKTSSCKFPTQHEVAPMELDLSSDLIKKAMANSGYKHHKMKFITIGDNDESDCQHFDMEFDVKVSYVD